MLRTNESEASPEAKIVTQFIQTIDTRPYPADDVAQFLAEGYVDHDRTAASNPDESDAESLLGFMQALVAAFPDSVHEIELLETTSAGLVFVRWRFTGTHKGDFIGMAPQGKKIDMRGMECFRVVDGKLKDHWHVEQLAALFSQLK